MLDLVLSGGLVVDGTRRKPYRADIGIKGGKIVHISSGFSGEAAQKLDISGLAVAPGFIDIHSHSDASPLVGYPVESKIAQGVTTEIVGNCGISNLPALPGHEEEIQAYFSSELEMPLFGKQITYPGIGAYAQAVAKCGTALNCGVLIGHGTLRLSVMGFVNRAPTAEELEQLKAVLDRELSAGAFGMSLGLIYPPSAFSAREELAELAKVVKKHNAVLAVHIRNEGPRIFEAIDEMLSIAEETGVHLEISHLKLMGKAQWGKSDALLARIDESRKRGADITCDQYPFTASSTALTALMPHWSHEGGSAAMLRRLQNREGTLCEEMEAEMESRGGPETILVTSTRSQHPEYEGKYISELAREFGLSPVETVRRILIECQVSVACVYFCINEDDMLNIMSRMDICIGSDGYSLSYDPLYTKTNPHPRNFSTFPQFLQLVREKKLMPLEDAIYKITALPAGILHLADRGIIAEKLAADLTVFDPDHIKSCSTFMDSKVRPAGISLVIANGKIAYRNQHLIAPDAGTVLLRK